MKILTGALACGKTTEIIRQAIELGGILVVRDKQTAKQLEKQFSALKGRVCSFDNCLRFVKGREEPILMDQVDHFLMDLFKREISVVTSRSNKVSSKKPIGQKLWTIE